MRLISILSKTHKQKLLILLFLIFVGMLLESMSIGVLLPILDILINPTSSKYLEFINSNFVSLNVSNQTLFISTIILVVFTLKSLYLIYLNYRQNRFISNIIKSISDKLFDVYIFKDINFHLNINSAEIIRNLQSEIHHFTVYLQSLMSVIIELCLISAIMVFIFVYDPVSSLTSIVFILFIIYFYYKVLKNKMESLGNRRQEAALENNKIIIESLNGIKEIKILNIAEKISKKYKINSYKIANINVSYYTISQLPRYLLELISVYGIFILLGLLFIRNYESNQIVEVVGIFVAGIFRIIPSINKVITGLQNIKYSSSSLSTLYNTLEFYEKPQKKTLVPFRKNIVLESVYFSYKADLVLNNINMSINKNETLLLIGESGSGKSTLIDIISGIQNPKQGKIYVDGKEINDSNYIKIGYVPQKIFFSDSNIKKNIAFGVEEKNIDENKVWESLKKAQLDSFVKTLENGLETSMGENGLLLSGGQQQRIGIARAFYFDPELLILDESTSSLDKKIESEVLKTLETLKNEITMIIISHNHHMITFSDKNYFLKNGKLTNLEE